MVINELILNNYRNHASLKLNFKNGINILIGENGVGKTNIIEAIYYLSLARSFKGNQDNELIMDGSDYGQIYGDVSNGLISNKIRVTLEKDKKQVCINGKYIKKLSSLSETVNAILFIPNDVFLFQGPPKNRRDFLDVSLSKKSPNYFKLISDYNKLLKERNTALKEEIINQTLIDTITEMMLKISKKIVSYRAIYVKDINDILNKITRALTGVCEKIEVVYHPFVNFDNNFEINAKKEYEKNLSNDIKTRVTNIGIHREDFVTYYKEKDIAIYGSQGENRIVALALKLAPYFLEKETNRPIVLLDDVMSELDGNHQERLIKFLKKMDQVFISSTKLQIAGATHYEIKNKEVL